MSLHYRLDATDWVIIGYLAGVALAYMLFAGADEPDTSDRHHGQSTWLSEDHMQRLEAGETVKVRRWHGHDLVLQGAIEVDAREVEEENEDA